MASSENTLPRLLLIEDQQADADLVVAALRVSGMASCARRVDSAEALSRNLSGERWDAIVCDYHMPGFSAEAALAIARASGYDGPFIVVSGRIGEESAVALMRAGAHDFVMKSDLTRLAPALLREVREAQIRDQARRTAATLVESERSLRRLTESMNTVREAEQGRIARELHDELGQMLTGLKLEIASVADQMPAAHPALIERIHSACALLDRAVDSVRRIAADLRPAMLDDLGLTAAVEWQLKQLRERAGVNVDLQLSDDEFDLPSAVASAAYRVVQAALTNVARHARARNVTVSLRLANDYLTIEVCDDGDGFIQPWPAVRRSDRFGLIGMRERVHGFDGELRIESVPGAGTRLTATMRCGDHKKGPDSMQGNLRR